jgi:hypothetical protein
MRYAVLVQVCVMRYAVLVQVCVMRYAVLVQVGCPALVTTRALPCSTPHTRAERLGRTRMR